MFKPATCSAQLFPHLPLFSYFFAFLYCGIIAYKIHIHFCKNILGVKQQTPNACIYGELGRYPLSVIAKERSIKFCTNIMKSDSSPIQNIYFDLCNHYNLRSWATRIHSVIDHLGYTTILQDYNVNINYFPMLKQRLRDQYIQN